MNIFVDQQFEFKELAPIFGNFNRSMVRYLHDDEYGSRKGLQ